MARKRTSAAGPALPTKAKRSAVKGAHIVKNNTADHNIQEDYGVFADRDEFEGPEYEHAVNSPTKNGRRLDNKVSTKFFDFYVCITND